MSNREVKLKKIARNSLRSLAPGMRFDICLENPKYRGTETWQTVHVEYNVDIAKERSLLESDMRAAIKNAVADDEYLSKVVFTKKYNPKVNVDDAMVSQFVEDTNNVCGSDVLTVLKAVQSHLSRSDQLVIEAFIVAINER